MNGKIKGLGLVLVAVLAVGAVSVAAASAAEFHSEVETTFGVGQQVTAGVYTTAAGTIKCKEISGTGVMTGKAANSITIAPSISGCTAFGQAAVWSMNGCEYVATSSGTEHIVCPAGKEVLITVASGNCSIGTPSQSGTATYTNQGSGSTRDVLVTSTASGLTYVVYGPGTICGTLGKHTDGSVTGTITVKGYSNVAHTIQVGVWVE
jgi:hypothetical protein